MWATKGLEQTYEVMKALKYVCYQNNIPKKSVVKPYYTVLCLGIY
jgi:hypothetical protein